ncbi:hypothetical protein TP70_10965 [Staphylococcus microti]|uniref:Uncharacterized protein n=1 Tax=Staphylococcus microti TaxID=569857 RepID=A0ABR5C527_9STAP|nr:hypothetical protein TP70_10965 [Staphylococcus microti]PNZ80051.1 hypothetical protein CD132_08675 [Staphylococcus microti]
MYNNILQLLKIVDFQDDVEVRVQRATVIYNTLSYLPKDHVYQIHKQRNSVISVSTVKEPLQLL